MATTDMTLTPATLEKIERNSSYLRRNSTGNFYNDPMASKVLPHYLLASSQSYHDYRKLGNININTYETMARNFSPRFSAAPDKSHYYLAGTPNVVPRNCKPVTAPMPSRDWKSPRSLKKVDAFQKQVYEKKVIGLKPLQMKPSSLSPSKPVIRRHSDIISRTKNVGAKEVHLLGSPSSRRKIEMGISKNVNSPKISKKSQLAKTVSASPKARVKTFSTKNAGNVHNPRKVLTMAKQKSLRKAGPSKQPVEEEVPEKTLYVVEPVAEKRSNISSKSDKEGSIVEVLMTPQSHEDIETNLFDQGTENKLGPIKVGNLTSEDGDFSPRKLKFRRGKVVTFSVGSEISSPRKLKFRPVKVLPDSQASDEPRARRLIYEGGKFNGGSNKAESECESPKVVLRHQDVEEKKDFSLSSFNNVIEETASKLVETRMSKVKALVGAFESLISIKDTK